MIHDTTPGRFEACHCAAGSCTGACSPERGGGGPGLVAAPAIGPTRADLIRLAASVGAHRYTNRHLPGEPAHAFAIEQLESFAEKLLAAHGPLAWLERPGVAFAATKLDPAEGVLLRWIDGGRDYAEHGATLREAITKASRITRATEGPAA